MTVANMPRTMQNTATSTISSTEPFATITVASITMMANQVRAKIACFTTLPRCAWMWASCHARKTSGGSVPQFESSDFSDFDALENLSTVLQGYEAFEP